MSPEGARPCLSPENERDINVVYGIPCKQKLVDHVFHIHGLDFLKKFDFSEFCLMARKLFLFPR